MHDEPRGGVYGAPPGCPRGICGAAGGIIYVDDDAPPGGDGSSWATAYRFLQDAMLSGAGEVRIAQGTYRPDEDEANPTGTGDPFAYFDMFFGPGTLRGGFAGIGAPNPDAQNIALYAGDRPGSRRRAPLLAHLVDPLQHVGCDARHWLLQSEKGLREKRFGNSGGYSTPANYACARSCKNLTTIFTDRLSSAKLNTTLSQ